MGIMARRRAAEAKAKGKAVAKEKIEDAKETGKVYAQTIEANAKASMKPKEKHGTNRTAKN